MAKEAERLLAETGWLPEPLRMADTQEAAAGEPAQGVPTVTPRRNSSPVTTRKPPPTKRTSRT